MFQGSFAKVKVTERPDVATAGMLEGKVAVLVDGSPNVLLMPSTLVAEMQSPEDYYHRWPISSFVRALRYFYLLIAFLGPSIYVAITTFHQELIPTNLLTNLIAAREGVPFPAVMEALMMELTMEALREAGQAAVIDPEDPRAPDLQSRALRRLGRLREAGRKVEEALDLAGEWKGDEGDDAVRPEEAAALLNEVAEDRAARGLTAAALRALEASARLVPDPARNAAAASLTAFNSSPRWPSGGLRPRTIVSRSFT